MTHRHPRPQAHRLTLVSMDDGAVLNIGAVADHDPITVAAKHAVEPHARPYPKPDVADHASTGRDIVFIIGCLNFLVAKRIDHASLRACKAIAMTAVPPKTKLIPTSRPIAQAAVPGSPENMKPAKIRSTMPLNSIIPQRPDSSRRWSSANMIETIPSNARNTVNISVRDSAPFRGHSRRTTPAAVPIKAEKRDHQNPGARRI